MNIKHLFLFLFSFITVGADYIKLTSRDGRSIEAEIIDIKDSSVEVERRDGFKFEIIYNQLSDESIKILDSLKREFLIQEAQEIDIGFASKRTDRTDKKFDFHGLEVSTYQNRITIRKPRNLDLDGVILKYIIFINIDETGSSESRITGSMTIQESEGVSKLTYKTSAYSLRRMYQLPNHWWDRSESEYEDKEEGIWVRLYLDNELLYEESSPKKLLNEMKWNKVKNVSSDTFATPDNSD